MSKRRVLGMGEVNIFEVIVNTPYKLSDEQKFDIMYDIKCKIEGFYTDKIQCLLDSQIEIKYRKP